MQSNNTKCPNEIKYAYFWAGEVKIACEPHMRAMARLSGKIIGRRLLVTTLRDIDKYCLRHKGCQHAYELPRGLKKEDIE